MSEKEILQSLFTAIRLRDKVLAEKIILAVKKDGKLPLVLSAIDEKGRTPLLAAAYYKANAVASLLVGAGTSDDVNYVANGSTALTLSENFDLTRALLKAGADIDFVDGLGRTALDVAIENHDDEAVLGLLALGADANVVRENGQTSLHFAARRGTVRAIALLLAAGANVTCVDKVYKNDPLADAFQFRRLDDQGQYTLIAGGACPADCEKKREIDDPVKIEKARNDILQAESDLKIARIHFQ